MVRICIGLSELDLPASQDFLEDEGRVPIYAGAAVNPPVILGLKDTWECLWGFTQRLPQARRIHRLLFGI